MKGAITDEHSACLLLYRDSRRMRSSSYINLKRSLFKLYLDAFVGIDENKLFKTELKKAEAAIVRTVACIKLLFMKGQTDLAVMLCKKTLDKAVYYEMSQEVIYLASCIATECAVQGKKLDFNKYLDLVKFWRERHTAEVDSQCIFESIVCNNLTRLKFNDSDVKYVSECVTRVEGWLRNFGGHNLHVGYYRLARVMSEMLGDHEQTILIANQINNYYQNNPIFRSRHILGAFHTAALHSLIAMSRFEEASKTAQLCVNLLDPGSLNWFSFQEVYIKLLFRIKNYRLAARVFSKCVDHILESNHNDIILEKYRLIEFYIRFCTSVDPKKTLLPAVVYEPGVSQVRYRHFKNCFPILTKDLDGYGILAVFAQVLLLLNAKQYQSLIERDESLQTYRRKRLSKDNYRYNILAKMIHQLVLSDFDVVRAEYRSARLRKALENVPERFRNAQSMIPEIIPLEELWALMLNEIRDAKSTIVTEVI